MLILYARRPDVAGTVAMIVAAVALALQPDRAMAGVLMAGLACLSLVRRQRLPLAATGASMLAFAWTILIPESLPAVPFVDRILYTAFGVSLLAGLAVIVGTVLLLAPLLSGLRGEGERSALFAFAGCWSAIIIAAALGNYPTPLVGYGGSAVLGYLLSVALLPSRLSRDSSLSGQASEAQLSSHEDETRSELSGAGLARGH
jgi:hypothetical protein